MWSNTKENNTQISQTGLTDTIFELFTNTKQTRVKSKLGSRSKRNTVFQDVQNLPNTDNETPTSAPNIDGASTNNTGINTDHPSSCSDDSKSSSISSSSNDNNNIVNINYINNNINIYNSDINAIMSTPNINSQQHACPIFNSTSLSRLQPSLSTSIQPNVINTPIITTDTIQIDDTNPPRIGTTPYKSALKRVFPHCKSPGPATPKKEVRFAEPVNPVDVAKPMKAPSLPLVFSRRSSPTTPINTDNASTIASSTTATASDVSSPEVIIVKGKAYRIDCELGKGGSSIVYQVFDIKDNITKAIKKVTLPEDDSIAQGYIEEVETLSKLQSCDGVITMFDSELVTIENDQKILYVIMEKGETDLSILMKSVSKSDHLRYVAFCWGGMLSVVKQMHDHDIIHSDLKPANFVLVKGKLKIIDFGISSSVGDKTSIYKDFFCGTINYMSPEAVSFVKNPSGQHGYRISKKSDIWSLGCILYSWIYGHVPFNKRGKTWDRLYDIASKKVEFPAETQAPQGLLESMKRCLEKDPKLRPTAAELLNTKIEFPLTAIL